MLCDDSVVTAENDERSRSSELTAFDKNSVDFLCGNQYLVLGSLPLEPTTTTYTTHNSL